MDLSGGLTDRQLGWTAPDHHTVRQVHTISPRLTLLAVTEAGCTQSDIASFLEDFASATSPAIAILSMVDRS